MSDKQHTCAFCGNVATKVAMVSTPSYYKGISLEEQIPFCNEECVKSILISAKDCDNEAVEQAIKVVKALKSVYLETEAAEQYRKQLLRDAAKYAYML